MNDKRLKLTFQGRMNIKYVEKQTIYRFDINSNERLMLIGLLSMVLDDKEVKLDEEGKDVFHNMFNVLRKTTF